MPNNNNYSIQNYLIDSIKQINDEYTNIINANHPYPCGIYQKYVHNNQKAIECTNCKHWIHIKCNGTSIMDYNQIIVANSNLTERNRNPGQGMVV